MSNWAKYWYRGNQISEVLHVFTYVVFVCSFCFVLFLFVCLLVSQLVSQLVSLFCFNQPEDCLRKHTSLTLRATMGYHYNPSKGRPLGIYKGRNFQWTRKCFLSENVSLMSLYNPKRTLGAINRIDYIEEGLRRLNNTTAYKTVPSDLTSRRTKYVNKKKSLT